MLFHNDFGHIRVFHGKRREFLKLCYLVISLIVIFSSKFEVKDGFSFNFTSLQKCLPNDFFDFETITSCDYIQHFTLHKNLVSLTISNLKYKNHIIFYYFLLLLSGDKSLNPGSVQISAAANVNIWEPLNKKGLHFLHINTNILLPKSINYNALPIRLKKLLLG